MVVCLGSQFTSQQSQPRPVTGSWTSASVQSCSISSFSFLYDLPTLAQLTKAICCLSGYPVCMPKIENTVLVGKNKGK